MNYRRQRMLHRNRPEHPSQRVKIGDITRDNTNLRAIRGQLRDQLGPATTATDQQQTPHPMLNDQMTSQQRTQTTRATGNQHRATPTGIQPPRNTHRRHQPVTSRDPRQPGREHLTTTNPGLRLTGAHGHRDRPGRNGIPIDIDKPEPARMLHLRRTHQPPHPGSSKIRHTTNSTSSHKHRSHPSEPGVGQPDVDQVQDLGGQLTDRLRHGRARSGDERDDHRFGHRDQVRQGAHGLRSRQRQIA